MTRDIQLTLGKVATVDDDLYDWLNRWEWIAKKDKRGNWYACRREAGKLIQMHREVLGVTDPSVKVDHQDGDGLHNWKGNLRACSNAENSRNRRRNRNNKTGYKGVVVEGVKFRARIRVFYHLIHLGRYNTAEEAARAYDVAARAYYGKFARLNFPDR